MAITYLNDANETYEVVNENEEVFGNSITGSINTVVIEPGINGTVVDQNVEQVSLAGKYENYTYMKDGNVLNVFQTINGVKNQVLTLSVAGNGDKLTFADGTINLTYNGSTNTMLLGDAAVNKLTDTSVTVSPSQINTNITSGGSTNTTVTAAQIAAANTAGSQLVINVPDSGTATVNIPTIDNIKAANGIEVVGNADVTLNVGTTTSNTLSTSTNSIDNGTVYVAGTGNTLVNYASSSASSLYLGSGNNTISVADFDGFESDGKVTFDGGSGTTVLEVSTTAKSITDVPNNNFDPEGGYLTFQNIASAQLNAGVYAEFSTDQVNALTAIQGVDGNEDLLIDGTKDQIDLTGKLTGINTLTLSETTATMTASDLSGIKNIVTETGAYVETSVAGVEALLATSPSAAYIIDDTVANLLGAPASVFSGTGFSGFANSVTMTLDQAYQIYSEIPTANLGKVTITEPIIVSGAATDLFEARVYNNYYNLLQSGLVVLSVTTPATALQAAFLTPLSVTGGISIVDTAANFADVVKFDDNLGSWFKGEGGDVAVTPIESVTLSGTIGAYQAWKIFEAVNGFETSSQKPLIANGSLNISDSEAGVMEYMGYIQENGASGIASLELVKTITLAPGLYNEGNIATVADINTILGLIKTADAASGLTITLESGYVLEDSAVDLSAGSSAKAISGAGKVVVTGLVGVSVANSILVEAGSKIPVEITELSDNGKNLAGASAAVLGAADLIIVEGALTVSQANAIAGYNVDNFTLADSVTNLLAASTTVITKALADGGHLTATDAGGISIDNGSKLYAIDNGASYSITDTAANLAAAVAAKGYPDESALDQAAKVQLSDAATVAQIVPILGAGITNFTTYSISDSAANLVKEYNSGLAGEGILNNATSVAVTGTVNVAQLPVLLDITNFNKVYNVSDTAADVADYLAAAVDLPAAIAALNGSASKVAMTGTVTVAEANTLVKATTFTNWSEQYSIQDSVANLQAATSALLTGAQSVVVYDSVEDINNAYVFVTANTKGFIVADTAADLLGNTALVSKALSAVVTDPSITIADATSLYDLNHNITYTIQDTAADIIKSINSDGVDHATATIVTGTATVQQIQQIQAADPTAVLTYALSDTAANVAAAGAVAADAQTVTLTTAATVAQAQAIESLTTVAPNPGAQLGSLYISDTHANLQAGYATGAINSTVIDAANVDGVNITDNDRAYVNAAELETFVETGGSLVSFTTSALGLAASTPVNYDLYDTTANIVALVNLEGSKEILSDAGKVVFVAGGDGVSLASIANIIGDPTINSSGSYSVEDSSANFEGYIDAIVNETSDGHVDETVIADASILVVDGALSADYAQQLYTLNQNAQYTISDTVEDLLVSADNNGVAHATSIAVTDNATVAQITDLLNLNQNGVLNYVLEDTAAKLAAAPVNVLSNADDVTIDGTATVAQLAAIDYGFNYGYPTAEYEYVSASLKDTAANISAASQALLNSVSNVTVTTSATAAQGALLANLDYNDSEGHISYTVTDTAANIIASPAAIGPYATDVTVTGTATALQAVSLAQLVYADDTLVSYAVADTSADLFNLDTVDAWNKATSVTVTDTINVATAAQIYSLDIQNGGGTKLVYNIEDSEANIAAALLQTMEGVDGQESKSDLSSGSDDLNSLLGNAAQLTVDLTAGGTTQLALYELKDGIYVVDATVAGITQLPADLLAAGYVVTDTVGNIENSYTLATSGNGYIIKDTSADILGAASSFSTNSLGIDVTDAISAATAGSIYSLNNNSQYTVSDTAAALIAADSDAVGNAQAITVTDATTAANAATILGDYPDTKVIYALSDSAANLSNVIYTDEVKGATSIAITGTTNVADFLTIIGNNSNVTSYAFADTAANLDLAATTSTEVGYVANATAVTVTGTANGLQAADIYAANNKAVYAISDSVVADLFTGDALTAAVLNATSLNTGDITVDVAQAQALLALGNKYTGTIDIKDTATNIVAASQTLLNQAADVTLSNAATAAQADVLQGLTFDKGNTAIAYDVQDTDTNILDSKNITGIAGVQTGGTVEVTDPINVNTLGKLETAVNSSSTLDVDNLVDNSTDLTLGLAAVDSSSTSIKSTEVTDTVTVGEASYLASNVSSSKFVFDNIADSALNFVADGFVEANDAKSIALTGASNVVDAEALYGSKDYSKLSGGYTITDSASSILDAYWDQDYTGAITSAKSVSVTAPTPNQSDFTTFGNANVAQAQGLELLSNINGNSIVIDDTMSDVINASSAVLNGVNSIYVTADDNDATQNFIDSSVTPAETILFSHNASNPDDAISGSFNATLNADVFTLGTGVDILSLKNGDTVDLSSYALDQATADIATSGTGVTGAGELLEIQGNIAIEAGTTSFLASATGTSTLLIWDATGAGTVEAAAVLVGTNITDINNIGSTGASSNTKLNVNLAPKK